MPDQTKEMIYLARKEIVRVQVERFHIYYSEYFGKPETTPMVQYFFEKIYNLDGREEWVSLAIHTFDKVKNMIKDHTRENLEHLIELNNLTDKLDEKMSHLLLDRGWKEEEKLSQEKYLELFLELDHRDERKKQLDYVLMNMKLFYDLAHRPINAVIMKPAKFMSKILGVYLLFASIEEGYYAVLPVSRELFEAFYSEVEKKEKDFLYTQFPSLKPQT
ncbi:MAG: hypothetical protein K8R21_14880 [Leptospira sp.]|nr:hypothetical protein [Leptospira sp.]